MKDKTQPIPSTGKSFMTWGVFNWGNFSGATFHTKTQAINYCLKNYQTAGGKDRSWVEMQEYMMIVKVQVTVLSPKIRFSRSGKKVAR